MKVIVTGCGGFLGTEIVRQLIDRGDRVVGVSRSRYPSLEKFGMRQHQVDIGDAAEVLAVIRDADAVVHTAAIAGVWGKYAIYHRTNVTGTLNVIDACRRNGIGILVHTSSPSVTFAGHDQSGVDESEPYPDTFLCAYPKTKAIAEAAVLDTHGAGLATCALRPHLIWGAGDPHLLPRVIGKAKSGRLRVVGEGKNLVDTVHVRNAAAAHLDAIESLRTTPDVAGGRAYFIAQDQPVNCWQWIGDLCRIAGVTPPSKQISFAAAYRLGVGLEALYRLSGRTSEPPMTRFVAAQLAKDHYFNISSAVTRLRYKPIVSLQDGLNETVSYLKSLGG